MCSCFLVGFPSFTSRLGFSLIYQNTLVLWSRHEPCESVFYFISLPHNCCSPLASSESTYSKPAAILIFHRIRRLSVLVSPQTSSTANASPIMRDENCQPEHRPPVMFSSRDINTPGACILRLTLKSNVSS